MVAPARGSRRRGLRLGAFLVLATFHLPACRDVRGAATATEEGRTALVEGEILERLRAASDPLVESGRDGRIVEVLAVVDLQCQACARLLEGVVESAERLAADGVRVRLVHWPLDPHLRGRLLYPVVACTPPPERERLLGGLMAGRLEWVSGAPPLPYLRALADSLGVEVAPSLRCAEDPVTLERMAAQRRAGDALQPDWLPTLVVDGVVLPREESSWEGLSRYLEWRKRVSPATPSPGDGSP